MTDKTAGQYIHDIGVKRVPPRVRARQHLITTTALPSLCGRCRGLTLVGLSEGLIARVDPYPVARDMQVVAVLAGRWTYVLIGHQLHHHVGSPYGRVILAEHRCGQPLPRTVPAIQRVSRPQWTEPPY
jgi:hypothetical protein